MKNSRKKITQTNTKKSFFFFLFFLIMNWSKKRSLCFSLKMKMNFFFKDWRERREILHLKGAIAEKRERMGKQIFQCVELQMKEKILFLQWVSRQIVLDKFCVSQFHSVWRSIGFKIDFIFRKKVSWKDRNKMTMGKSFPSLMESNRFDPIVLQ